MSYSGRLHLLLGSNKTQFTQVSLSTVEDSRRTWCIRGGFVLLMDLSLIYASLLVHVDDRLFGKDYLQIHY